MLSNAKSEHRFSHSLYIQCILSWFLNFHVTTFLFIKIVYFLIIIHHCLFLNICWTFLVQFEIMWKSIGQIWYQIGMDRHQDNCTGARPNYTIELYRPELESWRSGTHFHEEKKKIRQISSITFLTQGWSSSKKSGTTDINRIIWNY